MTVGERLQSYRKQHNLSQEELAKQLFVTRQTISLWETDQTLPTIDNLVRLKDILDVSIDDILTGPEDKPEEENQPLESYEFKYSKPIFKSVFKTVNVKSFLTHLVLTLLLILNTVRTYFVVTDDISKGLYWGFTVIAVIFFIRYIISMAKVGKASKNNALKNEYQYDVFEDSIKLTVAKDGQAITAKTITPENIPRCWSTNSLYIFIYQNSIYALKKQCLDSNSHLHLFFHKGRKSKKKNVVLIILLIFLFAVSIFLPFIKSDNYITIFQTVDDENKEITVAASEYIKEIEKTVDIEIPQSAVITDVKILTDKDYLYRDTIYYNVITLEFSDYDAYRFEKNIEDDERWCIEISQDFDDILPRNYQDNGSDYQLFYNATDEKYNTLIKTGGEYEILYMDYDKEENCIKIIDCALAYYPEPKHIKIDGIAYQSGWYYNEWFMEQVGLDNCSVESCTEGNVESTDFKSSVYVLADYRFGTMYRVFYLAVENESNIRFYDLSEAGYGHEIHLADLDGDGIDEIIINFHVAESGGAGGYSSTVIKVNEYSFYEIFNSINGIDEFYTGFTSRLKDDFKIEISNVFTGYKTVIDYNHHIPDYPGACWDENGKVIAEENEDHLLYDSFFEFSPQDVDNDGIYELICSQYTSLHSHADGIGHAKSVLKYNEKYKTFEVVDAEFIPYEE